MKVKSESEVAQLCPTLSDPMDYSLPGSSIHGIFQARVLEWGAIGCDKINGSIGSFHLFILSCSLWLQKPSLGPLPPGSFLGAQGQPPCLFLVSSVTALTSLC